MNERTRREPPCLSDLRLDQLLSGELTGECEQLTRAHLATCARCEDRRLELSADRAAFAQKELSFDALLAARRATAGRARPGASRWRSPAVAGALTLSAALVALGVGLGRLPLSGDSPARETSLGTRSKGAGATIAYVVKRGSESFWGEPGQVLAAGDELRFAVSSDRPLYAGVWGVDALGKTSAYHGSPELAKVDAGHRQPLPGAVVLDDSLGEERLVAVFCARPVPGAELASAVASAPSAPRLPAACSYELSSIIKAQQ